jgi:hypothetical protein
MPRIELPDGHHAELRDPDDLRRADVRAAFRYADHEGVNLMAGLGFDGVGALQDGLLLRFVRSWSLTNGDGSTPLEVTAEAIGELPLRYHRPLADAIAPALAEVMGTAQQPPDPTSAAPSSPPASTD